MPWDTLRDLTRKGVEIASHTVSHPHLPALSDTELRAELTQSKQRMEDELGRQCRFVAYPYGHDDVRVHKAAKAAGYVGAFSLDGRAKDPFAFPRVDIYRGDGAMRFAAKVSPLRTSVNTVRRVLLRR